MATAYPKWTTIPPFIGVIQLIIVIIGLLGFFAGIFAGGTKADINASNAQALAIPFSLLTIVSMVYGWSLARFIFGIGQSLCWILATYFTYQSILETGSNEFPVFQALVAICAVVVTLYISRRHPPNHTYIKTG